MSRFNKSVLMVMITLLILVGCGGSKVEDKNDVVDNDKDKEVEVVETNTLLSSEDAKLAFISPLDYEGKQVRILGRIVSMLSEDDDYVYYDVVFDLENNDRHIMLSVKKDLNKIVNDDDFVLALGVIKGEFTDVDKVEGIHTLVEALELNVGDLDTIVLKPYATKTLDLKQEQFDHSVSLEKLELSYYDTRIYVKLENNSDVIYEVYATDVSIKVNKKTYKEHYAMYGEYPAFEPKLEAHSSTEGVIRFDVLEVKEGDVIEVIIEKPYTEANDVQFKEYIFVIEI